VATIQFGDDNQPGATTELKVTCRNGRPVAMGGYDDRSPEPSESGRGE
jgi:hypothetical protein